MAVKSRSSAARGSKKKAKAAAKRKTARPTASRGVKRKSAKKAKKKKAPARKTKPAAKALKKKKKQSAARAVKKKTSASRAPGRSKAKKAPSKAAAKKAKTKAKAKVKAAPKKAKAKAAPKKAKTKAAPKKSAKKRAAKTAARPKRRVNQATRPPRKRKIAAPTAQQIADRQAAEKQAAQYEKAAAYFNDRKFSQAHSWFQKAVKGPNASLRHRAQIHIKICRQQIESTKVKLKTVDDYYNYGVQLINDRQLEDAERYLQQALKMAPDADHVHYAAAVVAALRGDTDRALVSLKRAIELNARNRVLARSDADLAGIIDHPSIAELIAPDAARETTV